MVKIEDECLDCSAGTRGICKGSACPNRNVPHLYCDDCGEEEDELFEIDGLELCIDCVQSRLTKVTLD